MNIPQTEYWKNLTLPSGWKREEHYTPPPPAYRKDAVLIQYEESGNAKFAEQLEAMRQTLMMDCVAVPRTGGTRLFKGLPNGADKRKLYLWRPPGRFPWRAAYLVVTGDTEQPSTDSQLVKDLLEATDQWEQR